MCEACSNSYTEEHVRREEPSTCLPVLVLRAAASYKKVTEQGSHAAPGKPWITHTGSLSLYDDLSLGFFLTLYFQFEIFIGMDEWCTCVYGYAYVCAGQQTALNAILRSIISIH